MTLVLTVGTDRSIWLLADRRLSSKSRPLRDDAVKAMTLDTTDGLAILAYAGLGATARGTEPSQWMSGILRGRPLPLEQGAWRLGRCNATQLPRHLRFTPAAHSVVAAAFIGQERRLYTIDLALSPDGQKKAFRYTRHQWTYSPTGYRRSVRRGRADSAVCNPHIAPCLAAGTA